MHQLLLTTLVFLLFSTSALCQIATSDIQNFLQENYRDFQLSSKDLNDWVITDQYTSRQSAVTHVYLRQRFQGIEINDALLHIHFKSDGTVLHSGSTFVGNVAKIIAPQNPQIDAISAIQSAATKMGYSLSKKPIQKTALSGIAQEGILSVDEFSLEEIPVKLMYQKDENGEYRLAWDMAVNEVKNGNWWGLRIDAQTGAVLQKDSWTVSCNWEKEKGENHSHATAAVETEAALPMAADHLLLTGAYRVIPMPKESPSHGTRALLTDPDDPTASPFGWHDIDGVAGAESTKAIGNNVHAQLDLNNDNGLNGFSPDGGAELLFDFPFNTSDAPAAYQPAAVTNLFYWNNIAHDVLYHYGFDEESGNFQENNYGRGGLDSDFVVADAQDGSGTNNANFGTPRDGSNPRMQMYIWTAANPDRDSDFDNGVIVHEYGHGVSNRLTGGPRNVSCLGNIEQMGEGWSDYLALMLTIETGDAGTDRRGIGTYVRGEAPTADGIRTHPYSTDMTINPHTYEDIITESRPHGVGSVWCAMLWEMTWALIDEYGFDPDFYGGTGGNNKALALVLEGMKLQPCSPGFVDARDAVLFADQVLYGGANQCLIWQAFAKRGLGFSADQGESDSREDGTEAFDMPPSCTMKISVMGNTSVEAGQAINYTISVENISDASISNVLISSVLPDSTTYLLNSASDGGMLVNDTLKWPAVDMLSGAVAMRSFTAIANATIPSNASFSDDFEGSTAHWSEYANNPDRSKWELVNPNDTPDRGNIWQASDPNNHADQYLTLEKTFRLGATSELIFTHSFDTEETWDGGQVFISTDGGIKWVDLGSRMTQNGYNSTINDNALAPAFSGDSNGYQQTKVDLSDFDGELVKFRFWFHADASVGGLAWNLAEVQVSDIDFTIDHTAMANFDGQQISARISIPTLVGIPGSLPLELGQFKGEVLSEGNRLYWITLGEQNVSHFDLQRSTDGYGNWESIGRTNAKGFSTAVQQYERVDPQPPLQAFYRLHMVDFDDASAYSPVVQLQRSEKSFDQLNISPNPFRETLTLQYNTSEAGVVSIEIKDLYGVLRKKSTLDNQKGPQTEWLDMTGMAAGIYVLTISNGKDQRTVRVVKQ